MNILKHFRGSILLETLVSIVILGLIAIGSLYSYSFVHQRIHSQRQQRIALSVLQGLMEEAISSLLNPNDPLDANDISTSLSNKETDLMDTFIEDIFDYDTNNATIAFINPNIFFIDPNIFEPLNNKREPIKDNRDYDDIVGIKLRVILSNNDDAESPGRDLPITLYTRRIYKRNSR